MEERVRGIYINPFEEYPITVLIEYQRQDESVGESIHMYSYVVTCRLTVNGSIDIDLDKGYRILYNNLSTSEGPENKFDDKKRAMVKEMIIDYLVSLDPNIRENIVLKVMNSRGHMTYSDPIENGIHQKNYEKYLILSYLNNLLDNRPSSVPMG